MYSYITGTLAEAGEDLAVVENSGIGYNIYTHSGTFQSLPPVGSQVKFYTYLNVREDCFCLYGFLTKDELGIFKLLINVSGIGPRGGLAILSALTPNELRFAVIGEDTKTICRAPGIGAKTAKKLIIELKDKIDIEETLNMGTSDKARGADMADDSARRDALEALTALGYSAADAAQALAGIEIGEDTQAEDILRTALKKMAFL